jgi:hypothetical protein
MQDLPMQASSGPAAVSQRPSRFIGNDQLLIGLRRPLIECSMRCRRWSV